MLGYALLLALLVFAFVQCSSQTNGTIDDQYGDSITGVIPLYSPSSGVWKGANCIGCAIAADPTRAHDGTWTSATYSPDLGSMSIAFPFTGTALYVYFITSNTPDSGTVTSLTQCDFTMDGEAAGKYQHVSDNSTLLNYNVLVYSNTSLTNTTHQFLISTGGQNYSVFIMFDYAVYTFDSVSSSSSGLQSGSGTSAASAASTSSPVSASGNAKHTPTGAIVGGVIGILAVIGVAVIVLNVFRRRQQSRDPILPVISYVPPAPRETREDGDTYSQFHRPLVSTLDGTMHPRGEPSVNHTPSTDSTPTDVSDMSLSGTTRSLYVSVIGGMSTATRVNKMLETQSTRQMEPPLQVDSEGPHSGPNSASSIGPSQSNLGSDVMHQVEMIRAQVEQLQAQQSVWLHPYPEQPPRYEG